MSLQAIEEAIEKLAFISPKVWEGTKKLLGSSTGQKQLATHAAIGAGVGGAANVAFGDKNQSLMERATKGAIGGGLATGVGSVGRSMYKINKGFSGAAKVQGVAKLKAMKAAKPAVAAPNSPPPLTINNPPVPGANRIGD
jgi:hypothetical protein